MSDLIADGIHKKFNCWECGIDMIIISESEELINAPVHTNFFENRSTDYAKGALSGSWEDVWAK